MTDASVTNQHSADRLREYIPVLVIGGFVTGLIAAAFGAEMCQEFSIGSLLGLLVAASLCAACVIPIAARVLAAIREALKIPAAALRRAPLFEVAELPSELRTALRPLVRPTVRYLTLVEMQRVTRAYREFLEAGYCILAVQADLTKAMRAAEKAEVAPSHGTEAGHCDAKPQEKANGEQA